MLVLVGRGGQQDAEAHLEVDRQARAVMETIVKAVGQLQGAGHHAERVRGARWLVDEAGGQLEGEQATRALERRGRGRCCCAIIAVGASEFAQSLSAERATRR